MWHRWGTTYCSIRGIRSTQSLSMWDKPQWLMDKPPVRSPHSTRSSAPPPYIPWHSKLVFIIKTEDQPLEEEWRKEEEIMLPIWFDFSLLLPFIFQLCAKFVCVSIFYFIYFQHVCGSSSVVFHHHEYISPLFYDN
jgi:hypothetical protein